MSIFPLSYSSDRSFAPTGYPPMLPIRNTEKYSGSGNMRSKFGNFIAGVLTVFYMVLLVVFVGDVGEAVLKSLRVCFEVMIPSLYAFMIASGRRTLTHTWLLPTILTWK